MPETLERIIRLAAILFAIAGLLWIVTAFAGKDWMLLPVGALITALLYSMGALAKIRIVKHKTAAKILLAISVGICVVLFVLLLTKSF